MALPYCEPTEVFKRKKSPKKQLFSNFKQKMSESPRQAANFENLAPLLNKLEAQKQTSVPTKKRAKINVCLKPILPENDDDKDESCCEDYESEDE